MMLPCTNPKCPLLFHNDELKESPKYFYLIKRGKSSSKIVFHKKNLTMPRLKIKYNTKNMGYLGKRRKERGEK